MEKVTIDFEMMTASFMNNENSVHVFYSDDDFMEEWHVIYQAIRTKYPSIQSLPINSDVPFEQRNEAAVFFSTLCSFAAAPTDEQQLYELSEKLALLDESQIQSLLFCLHRVSLAIESAVVDHKTHTFVVSHLWSQRWEQALGGALFPAYVGILTY